MERSNKNNKTQQTQQACENKVKQALGGQHQFIEDELKIIIQEVKNHKEDGIIGKDMTYLAVKNSNTYMMLTRRRGLKVIVSNNEVYSAPLPAEINNIEEFCYVDYLDCFLLENKGNLYRKDLDSYPPYLFFGNQKEEIHSTRLRYSKINRRILLMSEFKGEATMIIINLQAKRNEFTFNMKKDKRDSMTDFRHFGEKENKLILLTMAGRVILRVLNYSHKKILLQNRFDIELKEDRGELGFSLAVSDNNQYAVIELLTGYDRSSRLLLFGIKDDVIRLKAVHDHYSSQNPAHYQLKFWAKFGGHFLWVGLALTGHEKAEVYDFDEKLGTLRELQDKRVSHEENWPSNLHKVGNEIFYTGYDGKLMKLGLRF